MAVCEISNLKFNLTAFIQYVTCIVLYIKLNDMAAAAETGLYV